MNVGQLMTMDPITVSPEMKIGVLAHRLAERRVSGAVVVSKEGAPLGMVTEADVLRRLLPESEELEPGSTAKPLIDETGVAAHYCLMHGTRVGDIMSSPLVSIDKGASVAEALRLMGAHRIRRLAVQHEGRLLGVVSRRDLLSAIIGRADQLITDRSDEGIRRAIINEIERQAWTDPESVLVLVKDGNVRLEGCFHADAERRALRVLAERVDGVRQVEEAMEPFGPSPGGGQMPS